MIRNNLFTNSPALVCRHGQSCNPSPLRFGHYDQDALHLKCDGSVHPYLHKGENNYDQDALHLKCDGSVHPYLHIGETNYNQDALHLKCDESVHPYPHIGETNYNQAALHYLSQQTGHEIDGNDEAVDLATLTPKVHVS